MRTRCHVRLSHPAQYIAVLSLTLAYFVAPKVQIFHNACRNTRFATVTVMMSEPMDLRTGTWQMYC